jgi:predicted metalloprotease with PDZ domain
MKRKVTYQYHIDLRQIEDDQLAVTLTFTGHLKDTAYFYIPRIIPGIYDTLSYGKFIKGLTAFNQQGDVLPVHRPELNRWEIHQAKSLHTLRYVVEDGWDTFDLEGMRPYQSSESHFDREVVLLNTHAVFGYFENQVQVPYTLYVQKPEGWFDSGSLPKTSITAREDTYNASSYYDLVNHPLLYAAPDTALFHFPHITIDIACYTTSGKIIAQEIAHHLMPLIEDQTNYLGGQLATDRYTFLIYHQENKKNTIHFADGLEHPQSTLVLMYAPSDENILKDQLYKIVSHEFFHTQVPLGLHSYEIAHFDFYRPKFSKHLWLYEGTTEYFTIHMPIQQQRILLEDFLRTPNKTLR